jgi:ABC-type phosphate transport system substrate-binding protein
LMTKWARAYARSNSVGFRILQGGSDVGVADVSKGAVTIGMSSRDPKSGDPGGLGSNRANLCQYHRAPQGGINYCEPSTSRPKPI